MFGPWTPQFTHPPFLGIDNTSWKGISIINFPASCSLVFSKDIVSVLSIGSAHSALSKRSISIKQFLTYTYSIVTVSPRVVQCGMCPSVRLYGIWCATGNVHSTCASRMRCYVMCQGEVCDMNVWYTSAIYRLCEMCDGRVHCIIVV